jgi:NADPH:quinone reductase-like Zn-dependent oxidoreductase
MIKNDGGNISWLSPALPALLGMDFASTITEIGEGVENYKVGDEVYGCAGGLTPVLDENHYSFEQVGDAYARLTSGQGMDKVVVEI